MPEALRISRDGRQMRVPGIIVGCAWAPSSSRRGWVPSLTLPSNSRAYVAEVLLERLDFEEDFPVSDDWRTEIDKRCREIDSGEVELISGGQAMDSLRKRFS